MFIKKAYLKNLLEHIEGLNVVLQEIADGVAKLKNYDQRLINILTIVELINADQKCLRKEIQDELQSFKHEIIDRYFSQMESFLRWNKEMVLVSSLSKQDQDFAKLKQELLRPFLEEKWQVNKAEQAKLLNDLADTRGGELRRKRDELHEKYLDLHRKGLEAKPEAIEAKAQVEVIDYLLGGAK